MQYILLIYAREDLPFDPSVMKEYIDLSRELRAAGKLQATEPLLPTTAATSVRIRDGETLITDGPFAETREALGGFYLIEAADLDEALAVAKRIPAARIGTVEVRPIRAMS